jgi:hypothetical protein
MVALLNVRQHGQRLAMKENNKKKKFVFLSVNFNYSFSIT